MGNCHLHKQPPKVKMSLNGPMGSNYEYACCQKEINVTQILNQKQEQQNGCEVQVHQVSYAYQLDPAKEKKVTDRIIAHQLIILENTGNKYIEKILIGEFHNKENKKDGEKPQALETVKLTEGNGTQPTSLVRPSSLNYKISLSEAVLDFIKKEMPVNDDQQIDVQIEDPPKNNSSSNSKQNSGIPHETIDDFDDVMFDMTAPNQKPQGGKKGVLPQTPMNF